MDPLGVQHQYVHVRQRLVRVTVDSHQASPNPFRHGNAGHRQNNLQIPIANQLNNGVLPGEMERLIWYCGEPFPASLDEIPPTDPGTAPCLREPRLLSGA